MKQPPALTIERLKEVLDYCPVTGVFRRRISTAPCNYPGSIAGPIGGHRYSRISIDGQRYTGHQLAWLYIYGEWPALAIDHINGVRHDNRIQNLRLATKMQNAQNQKKKINNTSGYTGVAFSKPAGRWRAYIVSHNKQIHLGLFHDIVEASKAYLRKAEELFGEFRHQHE